MPVTEPIGPLTLNFNTGAEPVLNIDTNGCSLTGWGSTTTYSLGSDGGFSATFVSGTNTLTLIGTFQSNTYGTGTWTETSEAPESSGNWVAHLGGSGVVNFNVNRSPAGTYEIDGNPTPGLTVTFTFTNHDNFTAQVTAATGAFQATINSHGYGSVQGTFFRQNSGSGTFSRGSSTHRQASSDAWGSGTGD